MGDFFVQPIHRQRVLDEIVCANTEKLDASGQAVGDHRGRGCFNHHPDLEILRKFNSLGPELITALVEQHISGVQFVHPGHHGIHDLQVAKGTGAKDGAELRAEQVLLLEAKPNRAPAKERIHLRGNVDVGKQLVAAEV